MSESSAADVKPAIEVQEAFREGLAFLDAAMGQSYCKDNPAVLIGYVTARCQHDSMRALRQTIEDCVDGVALAIRDAAKGQA